MKIELHRMLLNGWFAAGICFLLMLCFFSEIIVTGDGSYTVIQILQTAEKGTITQENLLMLHSILHNAFSGYTSLFVPIISALPVIRLLYIEDRSGYKRFYMSRKSHKDYYLDKWIAGMVCGALMLMIVAVLFQMLILWLLPGTGYKMWELIKIYVGIFFYGACSVVAALVVGSFTNNVYFMICVPFMFTYFWDVTVSKLIDIAKSHGGKTDLADMIEYLFSRSYLNIAVSEKDFCIEGGRVVISLALLYVVYCVYIYHRQDLGGGVG